MIDASDNAGKEYARRKMATRNKRTCPEKAGISEASCAKRAKYAGGEKEAHVLVNQRARASVLRIRNVTLMPNYTFSGVGCTQSPR
jgi:hypothetical protein